MLNLDAKELEVVLQTLKSAKPCSIVHGFVTLR